MILSRRALGSIPRERRSTPNIFSLFNAWTNSRTPSRASIARGQALFNSKPITISGVAGINDVAGLPASFSGTCGTCHDTPNAGNHSVSAPLNIGVADVASPLDISYLPVFTLVNNTTHETVQTTDPGRALITGKWADIGKVKGPDSPRTRQPRALLPQRFSLVTGRCPCLLRCALQYWFYSSGES